MKSVIIALMFLLSPACQGATWFVRTDGGTRYSTYNTAGQCDGLGDVAYPGTGTNQHCAYSDFRSLYFDGSYDNSAWVIAGGDTVVVRGCTAPAGEQNPDNPHCRIGDNTSAVTDVCEGAPSWSCSIPPPPSGTSGAHTRILGGCAYGTYTCTPINNNYPYGTINETQLFGGFELYAVFFLNGSSYVDFEGLEITSHNGACSQVGTPAYPMGCTATPPVSDTVGTGFITTPTTTNITMQDVYIHGMSQQGLHGPVGGAWNMTRVSIDFNAFAGWNFDDGSSTPDAPGTTITQSYMTMIGNGCLEQYPIVNAQFAALGCWDIESGGFGDAWSGQGTNLAGFSCDHCSILYNTKDGALGPHTAVHNLSLTNSVWGGNMGQANKWGSDDMATMLFQSNLVLGNCERMSQILPGAAQNFAAASGLGGSNLTDFCRGAGDLFAYTTGANTVASVNNNTFVTYQPTIFDLACNTSGDCADTLFNFTNNIFLGYNAGYGSGEAPGLYYWTDSSITPRGSYNVEFGVRNGDTCGVSGVICSDPLLLNEPAQGSVPPETALDVFSPYVTPNSFKLTSSSPAIHAGTTPCATVDFSGAGQTSPCTIGAYRYAVGATATKIMGAIGMWGVTIW